jgi:hypothetical protein
MAYHKGSKYEEEKEVDHTKLLKGCLGEVEVEPKRMKQERNVATTPVNNCQLPFINQSPSALADVGSSGTWGFRWLTLLLAV